MADPDADLTSALLEVAVDLNGFLDHPSVEDVSPPPAALATEDNPFSFLGAKPLALPPVSPVDPFRNHTPSISGLYEWCKTAVCLPIALVRLVLFGIAIAVGYLATVVALWGWKDKHSPMPRWRCRIMWITRFCGRCILFSFGYHWIKRKGSPASRGIAPIVVCNHVSYIEPIFFFYELFPTMVASESHDNIPFVGTIIRAMQVIYVDRFSPQSRKHAINEIKRKASSDDFPRVMLFPEGTTTNGRFLISFRLGAFVPGLPVQPVVVRYPYVHFDQSWGNIPLLKLMFRMFTQFHNFMEVEYLPVLFPDESKRQNTAHFAKRSSYAMASALNVVQTSHSFGDMLLVGKASEALKKKCSNFMVEMGLIETRITAISVHTENDVRLFFTNLNELDNQSALNFETCFYAIILKVRNYKLQQSFNISTSEAMLLLDHFLAMRPDPKGRVQIHGFLTAYGLGWHPVSEKIFSYLGMDKKGSISFRQFLAGSAHIRRQPLFSRACEIVFAKCSGNMTDYIRAEQICDAIQSIVSGSSRETLLQLFDTDNDGIVSKDDFEDCLQKNPLLIALFATFVKVNDSVNDEV